MGQYKRMYRKLLDKGVNNMDYEICYYFVDRNKDLRFNTLEAAKEYALELSRELHYYPAIQFVANVVGELYDGLNN